MTDTNDSADLLYGSREIARYLGIRPRAAEHLIDRKIIPTFRFPKCRTVCAKRTRLAEYVDRLANAQEEESGDRAA